MSDLTERIDKLLIEKGLRRADICRATGISDSTIRTWITRDASPSVEAALKVAQFFGVTVEYLVTGINPQDAPKMFLSSDEEEIIEIYRALDKRGKGELMQISQVLELCYNGNNNAFKLVAENKTDYNIKEV